MPLHIERTEYQALSEAIESAFGNVMKFDGVLNKLNDTIHNYAGPFNDYPDIRHRAIEEYNSRYHIDRLLRAMLLEKPDNARLAAFAWRKGIAFQPPQSDSQVGSSSGGLERMLDPKRGFDDMGKLLNKLGTIANAICQISVPVAGGTEHGTGFLIGSETVLTNWHVVEHVTAENRKDVKLRFDYRTAEDGVTMKNETIYRLLDHDTDWLIDHAPYDAQDKAAVPSDQRLAASYPDDKLDYAVLRVAGDPGAKPVGTGAAQSRGFLSLGDGTAADDPANFDDKAALFIIQHPYDTDKQMPLPLQYDWEKPAFLGRTKNGTRALYKVNTKKGSSGSPCFNAKFDLIALHHAGGKDWPADVSYLYNQAIPIRLIAALLKQRSKLQLIK
jgi:V8-like Glu-specific endopeptidase